MEEKDIYEEYKLLPQFWGWVLLILFSAGILGYAFFLHLLIPTPPRYWDHGALPDTPALSVYSTHEPVPVMTEKKIISPLPEGKSLEEKVPELGRPGPLPGPGAFRQEREGR